jgi:nucleoredoxin
MAFIELFGEKLKCKEGDVDTEVALSGKTAVGIYFSAHWCPPCRGFTPKLAQMYNDAFKGKGMEIVFASSDRDESTFKEYFADMPWLALPFSERELKEKLSKKYKVQGIPSFVILDSNGGIITKDGRAAVMKDPEGTKYPWLPPTPQEKAKLVLDLLGSELVQKASGKPIGLYFSAHWCPPCRGFTPKLAEIYKNGLRDKMEIIFVSSDRSQQDFDEYYAEMPWLALPYDKRKEKEELSDAFGIQGIPSFVVIGADGVVITTDGRSKIMADPKGDSFPNGWLPQPCNDVKEDPSPLNKEQCVILFDMPESSGANAVKTVAAEYYEKAGKDIESMPMQFFWASEGGVTEQLRKLTGFEGKGLMLLDIPDDGGFYVCEKSEITVDTVREFICNVQEKKIDRKQLEK